MNSKSLAVAGLLAGTVLSASATANAVGTDTPIGDVNYLTDYTSSVTWAVPSGQPAGSYDVFTDTYDFTLLAPNGVTATGQVVGASKNYALAGGMGELQLYEGTYVAGQSLSSYTLLEQAAFDTSGLDSITRNLVAGNYFFAVEGTTAGAKGGGYFLEVTAVPEPANLALLLVGMGMFATMVMRKTR